MRIDRGVSAPLIGVCVPWNQRWTTPQSLSIRLKPGKEHRFPSNLQAGIGRLRIRIGNAKDRRID